MKKTKLTESELKQLCELYNLRYEDKSIIWEDKDQIELLSRRGRRYILRKNKLK